MAGVLRCKWPARSCTRSPPMGPCTLRTGPQLGTQRSMTFRRVSDSARVSPPTTTRAEVTLTLRRWWEILAVGLIAVVLVILAINGLRPASVQVSPSPASSSPLTPSGGASVRVPTLPSALERNPICTGVGVGPIVLHGQLVGGTADVWATTAEGARLETLWPSAFRARFEPALEILAGDGTVLAKEGDALPDSWPGYFVCVGLNASVPGGPLRFFFLMRRRPP